MRTSIRRIAVGTVFAFACGSVQSATADDSDGTVPRGAVLAQPDCPSSPAVVCPCPASTSDASSGRFGIRLLDAVSGEGGSNSLISPLGIGAVLAMLSQGAKEPVRQSLRAMIRVGNGRRGDAEEAAAMTPESPDGTEAGDSDTPGDSDGAASGRSEVDRDLDDGHAETSPAGGGAGDALACRLTAVLEAAGEDAGVALHIVSAAFAHQRLDLFPSFAAALRYRFGARVERLDFSDPDTVSRINAWVARETGDAIPDLVSHLDPDDLMVLVNAMHFRGEWSVKFNPELTVPMPFHLHEGATIEAATMQAEGLSARYREGVDFQAVELPYGGGEFALVVVLPRQGLTPSGALRELVSDPSWLAGKGFRRTTGYLALPRVALDGEASLLPALHAIGLARALDDADAFAGIASPPPALSRVVHRTMLVLDEQGTEAAAATAAVMTTRAAIPDDEGFEMQVDRPFALAVRHLGTGTLLFAAWVAHPASG